MTIPVKPAAFLPLAKLPPRVGSEKARAARDDDLMRLAAQSEAQAEAALANLRQRFDERLSVLQGESAATRLQSTIRGRAKLGGKVKAGSD